MPRNIRLKQKYKIDLVFGTGAWTLHHESGQVCREGNNKDRFLTPVACTWFGCIRRFWPVVMACGLAERHFCSTITTESVRNCASGGFENGTTGFFSDVLAALLLCSTRKSHSLYFWTFCTLCSDFFRATICALKDFQPFPSI
jgi:hypothetical protein